MSNKNNRNENNNNYLYLDSAGYAKLLQEVDFLKAKLYSAVLESKDSVRVVMGGDDDGCLVESPDDSALIARRLQNVTERLSRVKIIERHNADGKVDIGDVVGIEMIYSKGDYESMNVKLVGSDGDMDAEIPEISINSPLGKAIFGKMVGEQTSYTVNSNIVSVKIVDILASSREQDDTNVRTRK